MDCNLKVLNAIYDNNENLYQANYIPFSISTLKILIQNQDDYDVDILIKPYRSQNDDDFCGGFDDDYAGLKILWGGGQENGVSVVVNKNTKRYVYFFVYHQSVSKLLDNYYHTLTLQIKKTLRSSKKESIIEEMKIRLNPYIQSLMPLDKVVVNQNIQDYSTTHSKITFIGNLIPFYYPRWYPEIYPSLIQEQQKCYQLSNNDLVSRISLKIFKNKKGSDNKNQITLYFLDKPIATIQGDLDGSSYHVDLFIFQDTLIVRIWLLWISKKQFSDRDDLVSLQTVASNKKIERVFFNNPELPDIERFDIVISSNGKIIAVGTDFHWQELWYDIQNDSNNKNGQIEGIITKLLLPADESLSRLLNRHLVNNQYTDIIENLQNLIISLDKEDNNSSSISKNESQYIQYEEIERILNKHMINNESIITTTTKGKNILKSHVPFVRKATISVKMISQIVDKYY